MNSTVINLSYYTQNLLNLTWTLQQCKRQQRLRPPTRIWLSVHAKQTIITTDDYC